MKKVKVELNCWICKRTLEQVQKDGEAIENKPLGAEFDFSMSESFQDSYLEDVFGDNLKLCEVCHSIIDAVSMKNLEDYDKGEFDDYFGHEEICHCGNRNCKE